MDKDTCSVAQERNNRTVSGITNKGVVTMDPKKKAKIEERDSLKVRTRGEMIAAIRKKLGYSQEELEWRSGVSKTQISRIERDCTNPSIETIRKLEEALDVPLIDLFLDQGSIDQDSLMQVKQPGALLSQFEKKLARKQLSPTEVSTILNRALAEIEKKKVKQPERENDGKTDEQSTQNGAEGPPEE